MQTIKTGTRGLYFILEMNADRLLYIAALTGALMVGAWLGAA